MAEAILFNVIADIISKLSSSVLRELGSLWRVNDELDRLKDSLSAIQAVLHDAEEQQSKNNQVKDWVLKLEDVLYQIDDLIDESSYETLRRQVLAKDRRKRKQVRILFSKFKSNWKIGKKIKEIRQRLQAINDDKNQFSFSKHVIERRDDDEGLTLRKRRETHSFILEDEVIGRNDEKEAVIDLLLNSNTKEDIAIVSIVGMGGLGKTALSQSIYNHERTMTEFHLKLWVCVSEEFDLKTIIQKIIESATGKKPESFLQMDSLQRKLREQIDGKKYLLVMDDVWNEKKQEWLHLKRLLMGGAKGSRILITTRSEQVAKTFDSTFVHLLQILDTSNSWLLFQKMTGLEERLDNQEVELDQKNSNLIQIGKEIVSRLKGVPLVIRTIGGLLKDNKLERFWLSFKDKELYQVLGQGQDDLKEMQLIIELSYKYLSADLKKCFLYCALFPKDYKIRKDELILLWRAQGFIQPNENNDDNYLADIGDDYFMELLSRSFFQEVEKDGSRDIIACKMHDLMHDLACSITNNECVRGLKGNVINKRTRHLFLKKDRHIEDQLLGPLSKATHLRTFFILDYDRFGSKWNFKEIFCNIFRLRALHLHFLFHKINGVQHLEFIDKLKHLRYLSITGSNSTYLPDSITKLYNLETLIFRNSCLNILPNDVGNLINLKHLDLSDNMSIEFLPDSVNELCKLEALILNGCYELKELPKDTKSLINLKHLYLKKCWSLTHMPKGLGELTNLQTMKRFVLGKNKGGELKELDGLTKLRGNLSIEHLEFCTNIVDQQMNGKLLQLKSGLQELKLCWYKYMVRELEGVFYNVIELEDVIYESVLDCLQPHSNLQTIHINGYGGVKLCDWVSSNFLGCLATIHLINCERLQHLPRFDQFPNLQNLMLDGLPNIEYIIVNNDDSVSSSTKFPSLEILTIANMPKLVSWCEGTTSTKSPIIIFPYLSTLKIQDPCPLHMLEVCPAPNLKSLTINASKDALYENLTSSCCWDLRKLEYLPDCWQHYMTSLQHLSIKNCKNLKILPEWIGNLTSLKQLEIACCEKLTLLPEGIRHIHNLQYLKILNCRRILVNRCKQETGEDWPKIAHIPTIIIENTFHYADEVQVIACQRPICIEKEGIKKRGGN